MSVQIKRLAGHAPEILVVVLGIVAFLVDAAIPHAAAQPAGADVITVPDSSVLQNAPQEIFADEIAATDEQHSPEQWIEAEVLFREAKRLHLDDGDIVVRRRLIQKMQYVLDGMSPPPLLTDASILGYYDAHRERYEEPAAQTFTQIFFNQNQGGERARARAAQALALLDGVGKQAASGTWGDPYPDGARYWEISDARIRQTFGPKFLEQLRAAPLQRWSGPFQSTHGVHLVYREESIPPHLPPIEQMRNRVARDMLDEARLASRQSHYEQLKSHYTIVKAGGAAQ